MPPQATTATAASQQRRPWRAYWPQLAVALVWTLEIFCFQALSFKFDYPVPLLKQYGAIAIRLALDTCFALTLALMLPRLAMAICAVLFILFTQGALYYQAVFGRVLSLSSIRMQWHEGITAFQFSFNYVAIVPLLLLTATLLLKLWLLRRYRHGQRWRMAGLATLGLYAAILAGAMCCVDSPRKLRAFVSGDRFGMTYGFLPLWISEALYLDSAQLLQEAVARRAQATDRLTPLEAPLQLPGDLVILQVESLDWRILNHQADGQEVTPFLNRLAGEAMLFKVAAFHENGSGDADFVMLNAVPPSPSVMTYTLSHYPYANTLAQKAHAAGYETVALHGNSGNFFARRQTFHRMGFERTLFLEEMLTADLPTSLWGIRDDTVLDLSQSLLTHRTTDQPQLHYIITLTSHQPFTFLESDQQRLLPQAAALLERYYNSINFVDRQLAHYISDLVPGTVVVIFGDHRAMVAFDAPQSGPEFVPFIIHQVGARLADRQATRHTPLALSGDLTMVDVANYIHHALRLLPAPPSGNAL